MKQRQSLAQKINVLRASVMGANDGILSVAGIVIGVAGANSSSFAVLISGLAGTLAGTISMAMGEYVSVNTQKDSQKMAIIQEKKRLNDNYDHEFKFIQQKFIDQEISYNLSQKATEELMKKDALTAAVRERYGFNLNDLTSPYAAAVASMISFPTGAILPLLAISLFPVGIRVFATMVSVMIALGITGYFAAVLGKSDRQHAIIRNILAGMLTMLGTYAIGHLFA